jgi:ubiquinone/menaquinone biosynthesis C-methylase UbiE
VACAYLDERSWHQAGARQEGKRVFTESTLIYDAIYATCNRASQAEHLHALIQRQKRTTGNALLDIACGTGAYLMPLRTHYLVEGLDIDPAMLAVARQKLPDIPLHQADLVDFDLGRQFDAVICLGSSIGYAKMLPRLRQALQTFARHALPGGVVVVEPWFTPEVWEDGRLTADLTDQPALKTARILVSGQVDRLSTLDIHYLVGNRGGVRSFTEHHELGLFTHEEYLAAFRDAGLDVTHDPEGLLGRGLYIGVRRA